MRQFTLNTTLAETLKAETGFFFGTLNLELKTVAQQL
ncbi:hypothetical protein EDD80_11491 [Anseongella ginsenosidimutans]|uniref:Uncharacterized protein n=1 Tax=Anseongella ginsenosidimutans TaxID=496056 RepID=A0A4R3KMW9_9SPHI|nr:hypothetical protein EDD80_11491 [Anseongella ginsenosidimutans]